MVGILTHVNKLHNILYQCLLLFFFKKFTPPRRMLSSEFLSHYEKVPSLPVPELQSTLDRYLKYLRIINVCKDKKSNYSLFS